MAPIQKAQLVVEFRLLLTFEAPVRALTGVDHRVGHVGDLPSIGHELEQLDYAALLKFEDGLDCDHDATPKVPDPGFLVLLDDGEGKLEENVFKFCVF